MGMFTTYDAGVVGRYMSSNASIRGVGSLLTAKFLGNIRTHVRPGSKVRENIRQGMETAETPTGTLDPIPNLVEETLKKLDIRSEQIRFAVQSDVSSSGNYGEEWFVLTEAAIFTVTGEGEVPHYIPIRMCLASVLKLL